VKLFRAMSNYYAHTLGPSRMLCINPRKSVAQCLRCKRLDGKPTAVEPHGALRQQRELVRYEDRQQYYLCKTTHCETHWQRDMGKRSPAVSAYWKELPAEARG